MYVAVAGWLSFVPLGLIRSYLDRCSLLSPSIHLEAGRTHIYICPFDRRSRRCSLKQAPSPGKAKQSKSRERERKRQRSKWKALSLSLSLSLSPSMGCSAPRAGPRKKPRSAEARPTVLRTANDAAADGWRQPVAECALLVVINNIIPGHATRSPFVPYK